MKVVVSALRGTWPAHQSLGLELLDGSWSIGGRLLHKRNRESFGGIGTADPSIVLRLTVLDRVNSVQSEFAAESSTGHLPNYCAELAKEQSGSSRTLEEAEGQRQFLHVILCRPSKPSYRFFFLDEPFSAIEAEPLKQPLPRFLSSAVSCSLSSTGSTFSEQSVNDPVSKRLILELS